MTKISRNIRGAIVGGSECGKTSLAAGMALGLWKRHGLRTLVFDPWLTEKPKRWGSHAWATDEWTKFEHVVFKLKNCVVIWDEATTTGGRDRDKVKFFTAVRHNHPAFFAIGHLYSAFLPVMRASLTDLFIFRSDEDEAAEWAKIMTDQQIKEAGTLDQYQAIQKQAFRPVRRLNYSAAELAAGVSP